MRKFGALVDRLAVTLLGVGVAANIAATSILLGLFYAATIATIWVVIAAIVVVLAVLFILRAENGTRKLITLPKRYAAWLAHGSPDVSTREAANTRHQRIERVLVWMGSIGAMTLTYGSLYVLINTMTHYKHAQDTIYNMPPYSVGVLVIHISLVLLVVWILGIFANGLRREQCKNQVSKIRDWLTWVVFCANGTFMLTLAYNFFAPILVFFFLALFTVALIRVAVKRLKNDWQRDRLSTISKE